MTITTPPVARAASTAGAIDPMRNHARAAGIFYLLTFASSIPALILIGPVLHDAAYITGPGQDTRVLWGCLLDVVNALRRRQRRRALPGAEASERVDGSGLRHLPPDRGSRDHDRCLSLLAVVTMHQDLAGGGGDTTSMTVAANTLVDVRNWTFLFGPGLMPAFNAILLVRCSTGRDWCPASSPPSASSERRCC